MTESYELLTILNAWPLWLVLLVLLLLTIRTLARSKARSSPPERPGDRTRLGGGQTRSHVKRLEHVSIRTVRDALPETESAPDTVDSLADTMSFRLEETDGVRLLVAHARREPLAGDYCRLALELDRVTGQHGKISLLLDARNAAGREMGLPSWKALEPGFEPFKQVERVAVLFDSVREAWMASFCAPFSAAEIRYFESAEVYQAIRWMAQSGDVTPFAGRTPVKSSF